MFIHERIIQMEKIKRGIEREGKKEKWIDDF